jgi:hypothetical protein
MMWWEHFLFYGPHPRLLLQRLAPSQAFGGGEKVPLGQYLMGATYCTLHEVAQRPSFGQYVGHMASLW